MNYACSPCSLNLQLSIILVLPWYLPCAFHEFALSGNDPTRAAMSREPLSISSSFLYSLIASLGQPVSLSSITSSRTAPWSEQLFSPGRRGRCLDLWLTSVLHCWSAFSQSFPYQYFWHPRAFALSDLKCVCCSWWVCAGLASFQMIHAIALSHYYRTDFAVARCPSMPIWLVT